MTKAASRWGRSLNSTMFAILRRPFSSTAFEPDRGWKPSICTIYGVELIPSYRTMRLTNRSRWQSAKFRTSIFSAGSRGSKLVLHDRTARPLCPLAVLRQQMPLLRLQQPCARERRSGGLARCVACRSAARGGAAGGTPSVFDLLRRRHAQPDAARDGGGGDRRGGGALGISAVPVSTLSTRGRGRGLPTGSASLPMHWGSAPGIFRSIN